MDIYQKASKAFKTLIIFFKYALLPLTININHVDVNCKAARKKNTIVFSTQMVSLQSAGRTRVELLAIVQLGSYDGSSTELDECGSFVQS